MEERERTEGGDILGQRRERVGRGEKRERGDKSGRWRASLDVAILDTCLIGSYQPLQRVRGRQGLVLVSANRPPSSDAASVMRRALPRSPSEINNKWSSLAICPRPPRALSRACSLRGGHSVRALQQHTRASKPVRSRRLVCAHPRRCSLPSPSTDMAAGLGTPMTLCPKLAMHIATSYIVNADTRRPGLRTRRRTSRRRPPVSTYYRSKLE